MVLAKIPIVPQWNLSSGCACTPEGGFLYVGARSINYVGPIVGSSAPKIKTFHMRQAIVGLDIDPAWGEKMDPRETRHAATSGGDAKYFAVLAQDNSIQIWDFDKGCAVSGHKAHFNMARCMEGNGHAPYQGQRVLLSYMCNRNVLSLDAQELVVYCFASNTYSRRSSFLPSRNQQWTVLRCSPYKEHIFALGSSRGVVLLCDMQQARVLYTLRGHDTSITALSWTMVDTKELQWQDAKEPQAHSIIPVKPVKEVASGGDDIFDIYDYEYLDNEFGAPAQVDVQNRVDNSNDFVGIERPKETETSQKFDFTEACQNLKQDIDALKKEQEIPTPPQNDVVTLADCQEAAAAQPHDFSSSCGSNESTEGSLEVIEHHSSSSGDIVNSSKNGSKQQILHQAEVHATQSLDISVEPPQVGCEYKNDTLTEHLPAQTNEKKLTQPQTSQPSSHRDTLLASASVDGNFWIWNSITGASCDNFRASGSGTSGGGQQGKNTHIKIAWCGASNLLTNNKYGDLSCWSLQPDVSNSMDTRNKRYKFKEEKRRCVQRGIVDFCVCEKRNTLWCISSYRDITCEDTKSQKLIAKYSCASTNISAMRECPDDMNKIALGLSDRRIGIIDISQMSPTNVCIENFGLRIDSPVMSLVWSPDNKRLAYGTNEGRVGILNAENPKLQPLVFNPVSGKPIYSIDWQGNYIFVVCNDLLAVYDENMKSKDAHIITGMPIVSAVSVRGNYLFVGTRRGHLQIFRHKPEPQPPQQPSWDFELLQDLQLASRYITEIAWSPIASDRLAVVANMNHMHILSFDAAQGVVTTPMRKIEIKNPKAANACVKWSNRMPNRLLTCGFDGAVRIWDLSCEASTELFLKQFNCPMTCGLFLPTDEEIVLCAGSSTSLEFFDMRLEKSEDYSFTKWKRSNSHALDNVQWAVKTLTRSDEKVAGVADKRRNRRGAAGADVGAQIYIASNTEDQAQLANQLSELKIAENGKHMAEAENHQATQKCGDQCCALLMKKPATLLYLSTKELNKDALEILQYLLTRMDTKQPAKDALCAKLFGSKAQAKELLAEELNNHQHSETKGISSIFMSQLNMNIKDEILNCIQSKKLTAWHVSLAPTLSYDFWRKCCTALSEQLLEQGYALQAVSYMLALHNNSEAIHMLMERNYFKEALLIARIHLQHDDPLFDIIADKWISYLEFTGNLQGAAMICALSAQMQRAHELLAKMRNPTPEVENLLELLKTKQQTH